MLKLDAIDETRATLKTTENKLGAEQATAKTVAESAKDSLKRHLDLSALKAEDVLAAVNKRRKVLGLPLLEELTKDTDVSEGIGQGAAEAEGGQHKESALADLAAVIQLTDAGLETPTHAIVSALLKDYAAIEADPDLLSKIKRQPFLQAGLSFVEGPECPLCDTSWDVEALKSHLHEKLQKSAQAQATQTAWSAQVKRFRPRPCGSTSSSRSS